MKVTNREGEPAIYYICLPSQPQITKWSRNCPWNKHSEVQYFHLGGMLQGHSTQIYFMYMVEKCGHTRAV